MPRPLCSRWKITRYPLTRKLRGPQSRFGYFEEQKNNSCLSWDSNPWSSIPCTSLCTDTVWRIVLRVSSVKNNLYWDVTPNIREEICQTSGGTRCFHLQGRLVFSRHYTPLSNPKNGNSRLTKTLPNVHRTSRACIPYGRNQAVRTSACLYS